MNPGAWFFPAPNGGGPGIFHQGHGTAPYTQAAGRQVWGENAPPRLDFISGGVEDEGIASEPVGKFFINNG